MLHVVAHQVVQRRRLIGRRRMHRDLVQVVPSLLPKPDLHWNGGHDTREVTVVLAPERHELDPRRRLIMLRADPIVLGVSGEHQILPLGAHEPLMIHRGRVDEMAKHLLRRPPTLVGTPLDGIRRRAQQPGRLAFDDRAQLGDVEVCVGHSSTW